MAFRPTRRSQGIVAEPYTPRGAALELFLTRDPEVLIEGPAGTGKTRAVLEYVNYLAEAHPGCRIALLRKTRVSLTESVRVTLERKVLPPGHPAVGPKWLANRTGYDYPNGSHLGLLGMDEPTRLYSSEWDVVVLFEAIEFTLLEYMSLFRANRNNVIPHQQIICDTNPGSASHWLNVRANKGLMRRLLSRHGDNPSLTPEYLEKLQRLTGALYARMWLGHWVSEEGQVWECYDPATHCIPVYAVPPLKWYGASLDWGFRAPGCFQIWGVSEEGRCYRVHEIYRTKKQLDWWADRICKLYQEFHFETVVCDSAEPRSIEYLNDRLGAMRGRTLSRIARNAIKDVVPGLDMVRWAMTGDDNGLPLLFFVQGATEDAEPELLEAGKPTCTEQEIPSYVFRKTEEGKPIREEPDPGCVDHGCSATRYWCTYFWGKDGGSGTWRPPEPALDRRSVGAILEGAFGTSSPQEFLRKKPKR